MRVRHLYLVLVAVAVSGLAGCCCEPWGGCYPCGKNWCGPQCGELFWCEWFSIPPRCCDPCDGCGNFIGPRLNDSLYSHGNDYHGWCEARGQIAHSPPQPAEAVQGDRVDEPGAPPADEPYYNEPDTLPGPDETLPEAMPFDSSTGVQHDQYGRRASYDDPPPRGPRPVYRAPQGRNARTMYHRPVDSRLPSRTLAKPPRTRLFSR